MKKLVIAILAFTCCLNTFAAVYNVRDFGAKGDGVSIDSPAINAAIEAAVKDGGGMVYIPAGTYASYSIRLASHIHLYLEKGAILKGAEGQGFDFPEPGPQPQYQDYGHSHWKNSLIWGIGIEDVTISGEGLIDGTNISGGYGDKSVPDGTANKSISLKECRNVVLRGITIYKGGHFCILATGVDNLLVSELTIDTRRDGMDIDCCKNVRIVNCNVNSAHDDGIVLKASYALGRYVDTENVTITGCNISGFDFGTMLNTTYVAPTGINPHNGKPLVTRAAGRIKLGTESSGGFKNIAITSCTFDSCGGVYFESMDGGLLEDVVVSNLTMRNCIDSPIFFRIGARMRSPKGIEIGTIRRVLVSDINSWNCDNRFGIIVAGLPGHPIKDVTLRNIHANFTGGMTADKAIKEIPEKEKSYPDPWMFGYPVPYKGMMLRHVDGLILDGIHFSYNEPDDRPLVYKDDAKNLMVRDVTLDGKSYKVK